MLSQYESVGVYAVPGNLCSYNTAVIIKAMIINNTGLSAGGKLGHIELDSVTFERGKPDDYILKDGCHYYLFFYDLSMVADPNVALNGEADYESKFSLPEKIRMLRALPLW